MLWILWLAPVSLCLRIPACHFCHIQLWLLKKIFIAITSPESSLIHLVCKYSLVRFNKMFKCCLFLDLCLHIGSTTIHYDANWLQENKRHERLQEWAVTYCKNRKISCHIICTLSHYCIGEQCNIEGKKVRYLWTLRGLNPLVMLEFMLFHYTTTGPLPYTTIIARCKMLACSPNRSGCKKRSQLICLCVFVFAAVYISLSQSRMHGVAHFANVFVMACHVVITETHFFFPMYLLF